MTEPRKGNNGIKQTSIYAETSSSFWIRVSCLDRRLVFAEQAESTSRECLATQLAKLLYFEQPSRPETHGGRAENDRS